MTRTTSPVDHQRFSMMMSLPGRNLGAMITGKAIARLSN
jgi:hypothetical protein